MPRGSDCVSSADVSEVVVDGMPRYGPPLWTDDTLCARVDEHSRQTPEAVAVLDCAGSRSMTYAQLRRDAGRAAARLAELGVAQGDFVSIQLPNTYEAVVAAVAAYAAGASVNPLLPVYRDNEIANAFRTLKPAAFITPVKYRDTDHRELWSRVADATGIRPAHVTSESSVGGVGLLETWLAEGDGPDLWRPQPASRLSEVIFTSGTEARPKAVMHTEQTANQAVRSSYQHLEMSADDVVWMPSPVGHSTGFNYGIRKALYHGLPLVLQDRWDAARAAHLIAEHGCTYTLAATTFLLDLVEHLELSGKSLQMPLFGCGGAAIPSALVERASRVGITVLRLYGSTEVLVATWNTRSSPLQSRLRTEGPPVAAVQVEIRDDNGNVVHDDEPGELYVKGPSTSIGFFQDQERTAATYLDGWVRSGDVATLDSDGNITMIGRKKEIIIRGGLNIATAEVEEALLELAEVQRAAVAGVPDARLGERACAYVVLRPGASLDLPAMRQRLLALGIAKFKLPEYLSIIDSLPMTASGKVQKHRLKAPPEVKGRERVRVLESTTVLLERIPLQHSGDCAAVLTLNRPEVLNSISWEMVRDMRQAMTAVLADRQYRVLLITGAGTAFSAGGDLKRYIELQADAMQFPQFLTDFHDVVLGLRRMPIPTVALVNGIAVAGGLEIMLGCDLAIAARSASIGDAHQNFGQMGGGGVLTLLARMVGWQQASRLVFTGAMVTAEEALNIGLVTQVVDDVALLDAGLHFAESVANKSWLAIRQAKAVMAEIWSTGMSLDAASALERSANAYYCLTAEDASEGLHAFQEKRPPRFVGM